MMCDIPCVEQELRSGAPFKRLALKATRNLHPQRQEGNGNEWLKSQRSTFCGIMRGFARVSKSRTRTNC